MHLRTKPSRRLRWLSAVIVGTLLLGVAPAGARIDDDPTDDPAPPPTTPRPGDPPGFVTLHSNDPTDHSLKISWSISSRATSYKLQRGGGTQWSDVETFTTPPGGDGYEVDGLAPDREYCFRVIARNEHGSTDAGRGCFFTRDDQVHKVWRAQVRLTTSTVDDAGTDDAVSVKLLGDYLSTGYTHLDHAQNDFDRGEVRNYDVQLTGIGNTGKIDRIHLFKEGGDAWCVQGVALLVNGVEIYNRDYGAATCRWINDGNPTLDISHEELRAHPLWQAYEDPGELVANPDGTLTGTLVIARGDLETMVEGYLGDQIHGTKLSWGNISGPPVEISRIGPTTDDAIHVDVDLQGDGLGPDFIDDDVEVDVDFDLRATAGAENTLDLAIENLEATADHNWFADFLDFLVPCGPIASNVAGQGIPFCLQAYEDEFADRVVARFPVLGGHFDFDREGLQSLTAAFDDDANLVITAVVDPTPEPAESRAPRPVLPGPPIFTGGTARL